MILGLVRLVLGLAVAALILVLAAEVIWFPSFQLTVAAAGLLIFIVAVLFAYTNWRFRRRCGRYILRSDSRANGPCQFGRLRDDEGFGASWTTLCCDERGMELHLWFGLLGRLRFEWADITSFEVVAPSAATGLVSGVRWRAEGAPPLTFAPLLGDLDELLARFAIEK
jgi:hypothetical protein